MVPQNMGKAFILVGFKVVTTDASLTGWGAVLGSLSGQGTWFPQERVFFYQGLWAVHLVLVYWVSQLRGASSQSLARQCQGGGIYQPSGRNQKLGCPGGSGSYSYLGKASCSGPDGSTYPG